MNKRSRKDQTVENQIDALTQEIETFKQQRIVNPEQIPCSEKRALMSPTDEKTRKYSNRLLRLVGAQ